MNMLNSVRKIGLVLATGLALTAAPAAFARSHYSISIGGPGYSVGYSDCRHCGGHWGGYVSGGYYAPAYYGPSYYDPYYYGGVVYESYRSYPRYYHDRYRHDYYRRDYHHDGYRDRDRGYGRHDYHH
jgi:hypothetical protein